MLPEVFECPQCQRQFVYELVETAPVGKAPPLLGADTDRLLAELQRSMTQAT